MPAVAPSAPAAADPVGRVLAAVAGYAPARGLDPGAVRRACGRDARCAGARIAAALGEDARVQRSAHPDTDTIRWARTRPSVRAARRLEDGRRLVVLDRFGRKVEPELAAALATPGGEGASRGVVLDLRGNEGGDFGRMLRVAGALIGPRPGALFLHGRGGATPVDLAAGGVGVAQRVTVLVGPRTASSAEVLAALLRRHVAAEVLGERTAGKDHLTRVVPLDHDWRLLLPAERIEVPGETLAGGLVPDRPVPAALLAALAP
ncbi:MAG: S41 family peptidase [Kiloniellaceae bacterium]